MKVLFLVGGIGKRMLPITKDKTLIKFCGKTLIEKQVEMAKDAGFDDIVIVASPINIEEMKKIFGDKVEYAIQKEPRGMADAVLSAKELIEGDSVLIVGANDVVEPRAYRMVKEAKGDCAILGYEVNQYFPGGYLIVEGNRVKGIIEKPEPGKEPSNLVNLVFHMHKDADTLISYLEKTKSDRDDVYEKALDEMMKTMEFNVVRYNGFWGPIKYPFHILKVMKFFLENQKPRISENAKISEKATIKGNVVIEDNVRIFENAVINGPVYIGKNTVIANNALVRGSNIGENCVVGFSTEIARSYIADNVWFHNNYVGDSIVMDNCMFGSGCVTANFRFDEKNVYMEINGKRIDTGTDKFGCVVGKNCKTGINSSIYPGIKIGENSFIGPGVVLKKHVEPNTVILLRQEWEYREQKDIIEPNKKFELMKKITS
ncbi:MAG: NTP transferase domain-containing protein [Candidatus Diapherotrites archaeon]|nr:NTP transferase domain-containing protein [Candidatus Diapherotrites archaeon]